MEKYVSFIDILGFKEFVKESKQEKAKECIGEFSQLVYDEWGRQNFSNDSSLSGLVVSDCVVVYTEDCSPDNLKKLLVFLANVFQKSAFQHGFLLRASVTKGEFDRIPSFSHDNLSKSLIVGQAYIDAFLLEGMFKGSLIVYGEQINEDLCEIETLPYASSIIDPKNDPKYYCLHWGSLSDLLQEEHLDHFIQLAINSKWLPHYYQTLYMFLSKSSNNEKQEAIEEIWKCIRKKDNNYLSSSDLFIQNAFSAEVGYKMQRIMAKFLRDKVNRFEEAPHARNQMPELR